MVVGLVNIFSNAAEGRNNKFENYIAINMGYFGFKPFLEMIFHNLIDNAIKHTSFGTISFDTWQEEMGLLCISVVDTENGMSPILVEEYNNYFSRLGSLDEGPLSGLGFRAIKDILALIQATLQLTSELGKGSCFILKLKEIAPVQKGRPARV